LVRRKHGRIQTRRGTRGCFFKCSFLGENGGVKVTVKQKEMPTVWRQFLSGRSKKLSKQVTSWKIQIHPGSSQVFRNLRLPTSTTVIALSTTIVVQHGLVLPCRFQCRRRAVDLALLSCQRRPVRPGARSDLCSLGFGPRHLYFIFICPGARDQLSPG
jgi:hypothetical protein